RAVSPTPTASSRPTPVGGSGSHPHPESGSLDGAGAVNSRAPRARQGALADPRCRGARRPGAPFVGLIERVGSGPVALDTACFIYFIEEHPGYLSAVEPIFTAVAAGRIQAVTSALTLLEVLVVPYRAGDNRLAIRYEQLLTRSRGLRVVDLDRAQ